MSSPSIPANLPQLTSLRFLAALPVVFYHINAYPVFALQPGSAINGFVTFCGGSGVTFFFVLSGFILGRRYEDELRAGSVSAREYFLLRLARIYPLYIASIFAGILLLRNLEWTYEQLFMVVVMFQSWIPAKEFHGQFNYPAWSLSTEIFFYLGFILLVKMRTSTLLAFCAVSYTAAMALQFSKILPFHLESWVLYLSPAGRMADFTMGLLVHRLFKKREGQRPAFAGPTLGMTVVEIGALAYWLGSIFFVGNQKLIYGSVVEMPWAQFVPAACVLIYVGAIGGGYVTQLLRHRVLVFLGQASFALYLIHGLVIFRMLYLYEDLGLDIPATYRLLIAGLCVLLSCIAFRYFEEPARMVLTSLIRKPRIPAPELRKAA